MSLPADDRVLRHDAPGDPDQGALHPGDEGLDASDVIEGPIGAARLKSPDQVEEEGLGADLSKLPRA